MKYTDYYSLPIAVQQRIRVLHPDNYVNCVLNKVPALKNKSIIEVMNSEDGLCLIMKFLCKAESLVGIDRFKERKIM